MTSLFGIPLLQNVALFHDPDELPAEVTSVRTLLARRKVTHGHILELVCRTGPHGQALFSFGHQTTRLDRSFAMLAEARRHASAGAVMLDMVQAGACHARLASGWFLLLV